MKESMTPSFREVVKMVLFLLISAPIVIFAGWVDIHLGFATWKVLAYGDGFTPCVFISATLCILGFILIDSHEQS